MPPKRVSDAAPVQVYLDRQSRDRLDQLAERLDLTRSDVLRRGLIALERETCDPSAHPVLRLAAQTGDPRPEVTYDVAREHDRYLAEVAGAQPSPVSRRPSPRKRG